MVWALVGIWVVLFGIGAWGFIEVSRDPVGAPSVTRTGLFRLISTVGVLSLLGVPALLYGEYGFWGAGLGAIVVLMGGAAVAGVIRLAIASYVESLKRQLNRSTEAM